MTFYSETLKLKYKKITLFFKTSKCDKEIKIVPNIFLFQKTHDRLTRSDAELRTVMKFRAHVKSIKCILK